VTEGAEHLVDADRLAELLSRDRAQVIDIRSTEQRVRGFIPGSRHIPAGDLSAEASTLDRDRTIVFYGGPDDDAEGLAEAFRSAGFTASALAGGAEEWERSGRALETGG
jgi:rhodanese-related sulfurtransferase